MKKVFLLITAIILFYTGSVSAEGITCEYGDNNITFTVNIQDGNLTYDFKAPGSTATNSLSVSDFSSNGKYECLSKIYYTKETQYSGATKYTFHKYSSASFLNLKNPGTSDGSGNGSGIGTTPGGNTGTGNNTENPSTEEENNEGNNEVNVGFWGNLDVIQCGSVDVPAPIPPLVRLVVMAIKIVTPFVLIVMGMVDMLKAVIGSKDDEIKKEQQKFIKRVIAAVLLFFVVSILQFVIGFIAPEDTDSVLKCVDCLINDANECN